MDEKVNLALNAAENSSLHMKNLIAAQNENSVKLEDHVIALNALFESILYYGFAVSEVVEIICEIDENSFIFESLIEPHLKVVDDIDMIAQQYKKMYVNYISKIAQGFNSDEAIKDLFL